MADLRLSLIFMVKQKCMFGYFWCIHLYHFGQSQIIFACKCQKLVSFLTNSLLPGLFGSSSKTRRSDKIWISGHFSGAFSPTTNPWSFNEDSPNPASGCSPSTSETSLYKQSSPKHGETRWDQKLLKMPGELFALGDVLETFLHTPTDMMRHGAPDVPQNICSIASIGYIM